MYGIGWCSHIETRTEAERHTYNKHSWFRFRFRFRFGVCLTRPKKRWLVKHTGLAASCGHVVSSLFVQRTLELSTLSIVNMTVPWHSYFVLQNRSTYDQIKTRHAHALFFVYVMSSAVRLELLTANIAIAESAFLSSPTFDIWLCIDSNYPAIN